MKFSFIIPVYNCQAYLERCVESILFVGVSEFEIILVDDGSTDGSGVLCDSLAEKHPQLRVVHQKNGGAAAARNCGIREARGEYILFADADDTIDAAALRGILRDPRCGNADMTVYGMSFDYYYHGRCYRSNPMYYDLDGIMTKEQWGVAFWELYINNSLSPLWNKVFRRSLLQTLALNEAMFLYEDFEFVLRYMGHCDLIFNAPSVVYRYRQAEDEGNAKRRLKKINSISAFLGDIEASLDRLCMANPSVSKEAAEKVLLSLFLVLAREKISVSNLYEIRQICRDFAAWCEIREIPCPNDASWFHHHLKDGKALALLLGDKKTALRHKLAVWVKSRCALLRRRKSS